MKKVFIFSLFFCFVQAMVSAQDVVAVSQAVEAADEAPLSWDQTKVDLGEIPQNVPAKATFKVTNNSDQPLFITDVKKTCGCTVPSYEQGAIAPGESTIISAEYNAKKKGRFSKVIRVHTTLTEKPIPLTISGEVITE